MSTYTEPPLTIADLDAAPDDGNRYELIEGELFVSAAPSYFHQTILVRVIIALGNYLRDHPIGELTPGTGIVFDDFNGVVPDLVFLTRERKKRILDGGRLKAAPEIVMEILSPGNANVRRDRVVKRNLYSVRGVHEYWILDPETRSIDVHRKRKEGGLEFVATLQCGDELTSPLLPDFRLPVEPLFAE
jgi:Uma2 family endonuclease